MQPGMRLSNCTALWVEVLIQQTKRSYSICNSWRRFSKIMLPTMMTFPHHSEVEFLSLEISHYTEMCSFLPSLIRSVSLPFSSFSLSRTCIYKSLGNRHTGTFLAPLHVLSTLTRTIPGSYSISKVGRLVIFSLNCN